MTGGVISVPFSQMGTLYTLGYTQREATASLFWWMQEEALLIDIRFSPRSRWSPQWNKSALERTYGARYLWDQRLGNVNYRNREAGIELAQGHEQAISALATLLLQGTSLILLCACKDARVCHRSLVAKLIADEVDQRREEGER